MESDLFDDMMIRGLGGCRECRRGQMLPIGSDPSVDISTQLMAMKIEQIHVNLLQHATKGRLTWRGNEIVSTTPHLRRRDAVIARTSMIIEDEEATQSQCHRYPIIAVIPRSQYLMAV